jgi:hypothetical protein
VYVAEDSAGDLAGLLLLDNYCLDRWVAHPLIEDAAAARVLAPIIDDSSSWGIEGMGRHVSAFEGLVTRAVGAPASRLFVLVHYEFFRQPGAAKFADDMLGPLDSRTRLAGHRDLSALVELYDGFEIQRIPTRRRLRAYLGRVLDRLPVIVAERDGKIVAATRGEAQSAYTMLWDDATVLPEYRGQKLNLAMIRRALDIAASMQLNSAGTMQPSNPTRIPTEVPGPTGGPDRLTGMLQRLAMPPERFHGQYRLRRLSETLEGRRVPRTFSPTA